MINTIVNSITAPLIALFMLFTGQPQAPVNVGATLPSATAVFETSLASPITSSATTFTLVSNSVRGGGSLSGFNCFSIDEGSAQAETVCGMVSGTTVSSVTRGISQSTGTTTVAALQFSHRRGANVKITDFPLVQILKAQNNGEDTFENPLRYASGVSTSALAANGQNIASVAYANSLSFGAIPAASETASGFVELATQTEAASSTSSGSAARLVLPASIATSTYNQATAPLRVVVTKNDGTIDANFLPSTISKSILIAASTTFTGTTTFSGPTSGLTSFGDGSDGDVTISVPTSLTRDMYYNNLTINSTLNPAGWSIYVRDTLSGNGLIDISGNPGTSGNSGGVGQGGSATTTGKFWNTAGGNGGDGDPSPGNGTTGGSSLTVIGSSGGQGGAGGDDSGGGGGSGGTGASTGNKTLPIKKTGVFRFNSIYGLDMSNIGSTSPYVGGIGGGGGGGGDSTSSTSGGNGGGGGAGGGIVHIAANIFAGSFNIKANGGNGGSGDVGTSASGGSGGGGAGGGGGAALVLYNSKFWTGTYILSGGTGGAGGAATTGSAGSNGANGTDGVSYEIWINNTL